VTSGQYNGALYLDGKSRNTKQLLALNAAAVVDGVIPTGEVEQVIIFGDRYLYPTGFIPALNADSILQGLSSWGNRQLFSATTSGEVYQQVDVLSAIQDGMQTLDYTHTWVEDQYFVPKHLTVQECNDLNYYGSTWDVVNVFDSSATQWLLNGDIDYSKYNAFLGAWGNFLYSLSKRLNING